MRDTAVLFIDPVATRPYDERTLATSAMGGTEATVIRVAGGLAARRRVIVAERARHDRRMGEDGVEYVPWTLASGTAVPRGIDTVVVIRAHKILRRLRSQCPDLRVFLWMHCFPGRRLRFFATDVWAAGASILAVSEHHRDRMRGFIEAHDPWAAPRVTLRTVYNPVDDALVPNDTPVDADKLVFFSSPHKGLDEVLEAFRRAKQQIPSLRLYIANPGYLDRQIDGDLASVVTLGKLRHADMMAEVREALCVFCPQQAFEETFGLVFAEANAVGTPVLAHGSGAASEIITGSREQLVRATDYGEIVSRLQRWRSGERPRVHAHPRARLSRVIARWEELLEPAPVRRFFERAAIPVHDDRLTP